MLEINLEFLAAVTMLHLQNDRETVFSLKLCDKEVKPHTVCDTNVIGALSPLSENSGV